MFKRPSTDHRGLVEEPLHIRHPWVQLRQAILGPHRERRGRMKELTAGPPVDLKAEIDRLRAEVERLQSALAVHEDREQVRLYYPNVRKPRSKK
jgi:hypothetical protein